MTVIVKDYVEGLVHKYPYWNRTLGADHFFVTCHDVGVRAFEGLPFMVKNSIRVVCSPSYNVDFIPHKDIALPQVLQPFALPGGGNDIENRFVCKVQILWRIPGMFLLLNFQDYVGVLGLPKAIMPQKKLKIYSNVK
jgi:hypothetical protein